MSEPMAPAGGNVLDVDDRSFATAVIEESNRRPVVVDFWADWCQPCRIIGPVLERVAGEYDGRFLLAKLDVDANPQASTAFRIQSIPAVKAFRAGRLFSEFIGAIPEASIRQWLSQVVPSEADGIVADGEVAERAGRLEEAEQLFRRALAMDPGNELATLGLARVAAQRGDLDEARRLAAPLRPHPEAERLLATIDVTEWADRSSDGRGPLAPFERAAAEGRFAEALQGFLGEIRGGGEQRDAAREAMLKLFAVMGEDDPLTQEYRRKLSAALF